jgi:hypothetical protein
MAPNWLQAVVEMAGAATAAASAAIATAVAVVAVVVAALALDGLRGHIVAAAEPRTWH